MPFSLIIGGLRPESGPAWDEEFKEYLKHHWREVNKRSGQPFAFDLFERASFDYNTEPACRGLVTARNIALKKALTFYELYNDTELVTFSFLSCCIIMSNIFHSGQLAVQRITGEEKIAEMRIPMLKTSLHPRSLPFIEHQVVAFPGSEDSDGNIWLSLLVGERGFITTPSLQEIQFDLSKIKSNRNDIFFKNIKNNPTVGLLFFEAARRARYRAWGTARQEGDQLSFDIRMGYPSCPKHIQVETIELSDQPTTLDTKYDNGTTLGPLEKKWILGAHTFYVGTQTKKGDIEASHRGGDPGFIEILDNGLIRVPDYLGNSMYSTLGNIYENPKAALLFVDYKKGETLQLTGVAELQFDQNDGDDFYKSGETGRFWTFQPKQWIRTIDHHKVKSEFIDFSPYNILTKKNKV